MTPLNPKTWMPQQLKEQVQALHHALEGFPVLALVESYAAEASGSFPLVDACLTRWQTELDSVIEAYPEFSDDAHQRIRLKQMRAREALQRVHSMLLSVERQRVQTVQ